jgi:hypothetical protein
MTLRQIIAQLRDDELDYEVCIRFDDTAILGMIDVYHADKQIIVS